jgi:predicted nucleic acid-binding protein
VITLDTSGILAVIRRQDRYHEVAAAVLNDDRGPFMIAASVLADITWMLENATPITTVQTFLDDVRAGAYNLDWTPANIERIQVLMGRYADLPLGFADAAVIECAERHGGRVLTTDHRHFPVVARGERTITVLPVSWETR